MKDSIEITQEIPDTPPKFDRGVGTIKRYPLKDRYQTTGSGQCGTVSSYGLSSFIEWEEQYYRAIFFKFVPDSSSGGSSGGVFKVMSNDDPNLVMKNFPAAHSPDDFIKVFVDATRNFSVLSKEVSLSTIQDFFAPVRQRWAEVFLDAGLGVNCSWKIGYLLSEAVPGEFQFLGFSLTPPQSAGSSATNSHPVYFVQVEIEQDQTEIVPPLEQSHESAEGATVKTDSPPSGINVLPLPPKPGKDYNVYENVQFATHITPRSKRGGLTTHMLLPDPDNARHVQKKIEPGQLSYRREQYRLQQAALKKLIKSGRLKKWPSEDEAIEALQMNIEFLEDDSDPHKSYDKDQDQDQDRDPDSGAAGGSGAAGLSSVFSRVTIN